MTGTEYREVGGELLALHLARDTAYKRAGHQGKTVVDTDTAVHLVRGNPRGGYTELIYQHAEATTSMPAEIRKLLRL